MRSWTEEEVIKVDHCILKPLEHSEIYTQWKIITWNAVSGVPKTTLRLDDSLGGLRGLIKAIILIAMVYCRKIYGLKSAKGKSAWDDVQEKSGASFHISSPRAVTQIHFILPAMCCQPGKLPWSLVSKGFTGGQKHRHTVFRWLASALQTPAPQSKNAHSHTKKITLFTETAWLNWAVYRHVLWHENTFWSGGTCQELGAHLPERGKGQARKQALLGNVQSSSSQTCFASTFLHKYLHDYKK